MKRLSLLILLTTTLAVAASAQPPQVVTRSEVVAAGEIEAVDTLDATRLYRLTVNLDPRRHSTGTSVEYEILTAAGAAAGGGMFTIRPEMLNADGDSLSVLTGFGGLELGAGSRIAVQLMDAASAAPPAGPKRVIGSSGIVDTCTSFCDRCSEKAKAICDQGVSTYSCGCDAESRTCDFTCYRGKV
ncbi:MAG TPA: hypothetical protein VNM67_12150 [Thermoanaerobaculia bacterium]|jgi:hypothetical protein|nr:hypothetical protein [Thermoanaerobaculia bacterium]